MAYVVQENVIMLKITKHQGNLFELTAEGTLDHGDYQRVLPEIEEVADEGGLRMLITLRDFSGWTPKAVADDLAFDVAHRDDFEKIAIVGEKKLEEWATKLSKPFFSGEMKFFEEEAPARAWVRA
ncbi:MAG: STAS/SEC14 domain-containing protein [Deltaproteobacteria bacterium]|nr:STAS/SEC14 domain-containing protein [Deltaproteobacteria bacterium]